ncbi:GNAT family N-acetyltransferase [Pseudoalteromonas sp. SMS1]|uniref:GNAT family N-acetyltransferase n=1 Tax=Pseudoalteromonas sp. SMS1 TaxID=2908894 RepID=UPI001F392F6C|nr:GNAT family N-acetyltransferase [Pseudoalteromonas sp. SMS1]MCF2858829.1 GNAT family N-acetyltransferase [Pseudoalteromonas sp. SMS1]
MLDSKPFNVSSLLRELAHARHRQLLILCGSRHWTKTQYQAMTDNHADLVLSDNVHFEHAIWPQHLHQILGQEFQFVCYDGYSGIVPNMLAAAAGTVKAGGLFVLLMPERTTLDTWCDPALSKWLSEGECTDSSLFLSRFAKLMTQHNYWIISEQGEHNLPAQYSVPGHPLNLAPQFDVVSRISQHLAAKIPSPVLLSADRGRGKSAALGLISAQHAHQKIVICAQQRRAVQNSFKHLALALDMAEPSVQQNHLHNLSYLPPDVILATHPDVDILLIDEAAAIPVPILTKLLAYCDKVVFASTLVGYEGNGRGYTLRFQNHLKTHYPNYLSVHLDEPIRYASNDPLEAQMRQLFVLDSEYATPTPSTPESIYFECIERVDLLNDEELLRQIFALLVIAHYQTSVNDLRQLLDSPSNRLFVAKQNLSIVGVCLVNIEGGLDESLATQIAQGTRRPAGHMMAQQLVQLQGDTQFAIHRSARIVRIAISPAMQQQGIGQALVGFTMTQLRTQVSYFGSSFGAQAHLLQFWQKLGFDAVKLGYRQDKSSGEYAILVIHKASALDTTALRAQFKSQLFFDLPALYRDLPWQLVRALCCTLPRCQLEQSTLTQLAYLVSKPATQQHIAPLLHDVIKAQPDLLSTLANISQMRLILLLLQRHQPKELATELKVESKKQLQQVYQQLLSEVYAEITHTQRPN